MLKLLAATILILSSMAFLPMAQAVPGPAAGECDTYVHHPSIAITNVITAGDNEAWGGIGCQPPRTDHSVLMFKGQSSSPVISAAFLGIVTNDWGVDLTEIPGGAVGCTVSTFPVPHTNANLQSGTYSAVIVTITMTSNECTVPIRYHLDLTLAGVIVFNWFAVFVVHVAVAEPPLTYLCAATNANPNAFDYDTSTCTPPAINAALTGELAQLNYQCAATLGTPNAFNPATNTCLTPAFLEYGCGATGLTVNTQTNTAQCTNPQIDNQNRLCAASTPGAACTTPTINAALSGTINAILSGSLALSGTLTISDDAGGWVIHQDPITGVLTVHQDPICTAASHCFVDTNGTTTLIGNSTSTTTLNIPPGFWELFGPLLLAVGFVAALSIMGIWVAPGGVALGMAIFLHAFKQPYPFLVLLQAVAGICLAIFCLIAIGTRVLRRKKREPRRFFD